MAQFLFATSQLAQTTLRSVLGEVDLDELLGAREKLNLRLQSILDGHTAPWGIKVNAKVIHAEGEFTAAKKLAMAAEVLQQQPAAIQLRYLQTLVEIGTEKNTTIVFPLPIDLITSWGQVLNGVNRPIVPVVPAIAA